ncbi:MAG: hypothetical protein GF416_08390 [Candidatus Altiarchaeales archaeon]|nr:hypothetical protein [Candidatus Altiarchaeales archaeon]MBD3417133.1 hypothetical protein [Candidatus Altiarchaeales archaeon]
MIAGGSKQQTTQVTPAEVGGPTSTQAELMHGPPGSRLERILLLMEEMERDGAIEALRDEPGPQREFIWADDRNRGYEEFKRRQPVIVIADDRILGEKPDADTYVRELKAGNARVVLVHNRKESVQLSEEAKPDAVVNGPLKRLEEDGSLDNRKRLDALRHAIAAIEKEKKLRI